MKLTLFCQVPEASFLGLESILSPGSGIICYLRVAGSQRGYLACVRPPLAGRERKENSRQRPGWARAPPHPVLCVPHSPSFPPSMARKQKTNVCTEQSEQRPLVTRPSET